MLTDAITLILRPMAQMVGTAQDGRALVDLTMELRPDLVITDLSMRSFRDSTQHGRSTGWSPHPTSLKW